MDNSIPLLGTSLKSDISTYTHASSTYTHASSTYTHASSTNTVGLEGLKCSVPADRELCSAVVAGDHYIGQTCAVCLPVCVPNAPVG